MWWMQALFYGIGAAVIAIIAITAYKLSRPTNKRDPMLWVTFGALAIVTVLAREVAIATDVRAVRALSRGSCGGRQPVL